MKPRQIHRHPTNPYAGPVDGCELEVGDHLQDGDVYAWHQAWWRTVFPGSVVSVGDPIYIRPATGATP